MTEENNLKVIITPDGFVFDENNKKETNKKLKRFFKDIIKIAKKSNYKNRKNIIKEEDGIEIDFNNQKDYDFINEVTNSFPSQFKVALIDDSNPEIYDLDILYQGKEFKKYSDYKAFKENLEELGKNQTELDNSNEENLSNSNSSKVIDDSKIKSISENQDIQDDNDNLDEYESTSVDEELNKNLDYENNFEDINSDIDDELDEEGDFENNLDDFAEENFDDDSINEDLENEIDNDSNFEDEDFNEKEFEQSLENNSQNENKQSVIQEINNEIFDEYDIKNFIKELKKNVVTDEDKTQIDLEESSVNLLNQNTFNKISNIYKSTDQLLMDSINQKTNLDPDSEFKNQYNKKINENNQINSQAIQRVPEKIKVFKEKENEDLENKAEKYGEKQKQIIIKNYISEHQKDVEEAVKNKESQYYKKLDDAFKDNKNRISELADKSREQLLKDKKETIVKSILNSPDFLKIKEEVKETLTKKENLLKNKYTLNYFNKQKEHIKQIENSDKNLDEKIKEMKNENEIKRSNDKAEIYKQLVQTPKETSNNSDASLAVLASIKNDDRFKDLTQQQQYFQESMKRNSRNNLLITGLVALLFGGGAILYTNSTMNQNNESLNKVSHSISTISDNQKELTSTVENNKKETDNFKNDLQKEKEEENKRNEEAKQEASNVVQAPVQQQIVPSGARFSGYLN